MGLLIWIVIGVVVLAILGLGFGTFISGIWQGAEEVSRLPIIDEIGNSSSSSSFIEDRTERIMDPSSEG